jgi:hypothetical protein
MHCARGNAIENAKATTFPPGEQPIDSGMVTWRPYNAKCIPMSAD